MWLPTDKSCEGQACLTELKISNGYSKVDLPEARSKKCDAATGSLSVDGVQTNAEVAGYKYKQIGEY